MRPVQLSCLLFLANTCCSVNAFVAKSSHAGLVSKHVLREPLYRCVVRNSPSPSEEGASDGLALGDARERDPWIGDVDPALVKVKGQRTLREAYIANVVQRKLDRLIDAVLLLFTSIVVEVGLSLLLSLHPQYAPSLVQPCCQCFIYVRTRSELLLL